MRQKHPVVGSAPRRVPASIRASRARVNSQAVEQRGYHGRLHVEHETRQAKKAGFFEADGAACSSKSVHHNTPEWVVVALLDALGLDAFDLDPCAPEDGGGHVRAHRKLTQADDGLTANWNGIVFVNPPYKRYVTCRWANRCRQAWAAGEARLVVALLPARTGAGWWQASVFRGGADALFLRGRLKFGGSHTSAPFDSALVVWGADERTRRALAGAFPDSWMMRNLQTEVAA